MNTITYPVRNNAPLLDLAGRLRRVWPELSGVELEQVPANAAEHARFLWDVAQAQARVQVTERERLEVQHRAVRAALLERLAELGSQRDQLRGAIAVIHRPTGSEASQLQSCEADLRMAEDRLSQANVGCAEALAQAGLRSHEDFELTANELGHLGAERGFFAPLKPGRVWGWAVVLPGLLVAPALWNGGLSTFWRGLGLPDEADVLGLGFAGLVGIAVAHILKGVISEVSAQAAQQDAARRGVLAASEQSAHFRRWGVVSNLLVLVLFLTFAYIEGNLVMQALSSEDPAARLQGGGSSPLLALIGALVALTPASLLGMVTGRQRGYDSVAAAYRARSCAEAQDAKLRRPEVQRALRCTLLLEPAKQTLARVQERLEQVRAEIRERQARELQTADLHLAQIEAELDEVKVNLGILDADYGRRCEQLAQQADQWAAEALQAFEKLSGKANPGAAQRLLSALRPVQERLA